MINMGIEQQYCDFVKDWMTDRSLLVKLEEQRSEVAEITRGLPQGSSLSVLLWQLYIADMPINPETSALFMDDAALWDTAKSRESLEKIMQKKLDLLNSWCKDSYIVINASKTVAMVNDRNNEITLDLGDEQIFSVDKTKYLGVDLESRQGYMEQLYVGSQNLCSKLQSTMQQLMPLKNRVPQHVRYNVGRSLLMSKLRYHLPVMGAESETGVYETLQKQVNKYLRWLSHAPHSTPIALLQSQTAIPPIRILLQESVISNLARTMCNPEEVFESSYWKWDGKGENTSPFNVYTSFVSCFQLNRTQRLEEERGLNTSK